MRPGQAHKIYERGVLKMARQLKARADQKRYRPNVPFGVSYDHPVSSSAFSATIGAHGWVFSLSEVVHEDDVQHWRCRAALRNGFSAKPTAEDLDVLGLFAGEVTDNDSDVLKLLAEQVGGSSAPDGAFYFSWFEGKNAPKDQLIQSMLRTMDALFSKSIADLPTASLELMKQTLAHHQGKLAATELDAPKKMIFDKIEELMGAIDAEARRRPPETHEATA